MLIINILIACFARLVGLCDSGEWFIGGKSCKSREVGRVHFIEYDRIDMCGFADCPQVCEHLDICILIPGKIQMSYRSGNYPAIMCRGCFQNTLLIGENDDFVCGMLLPKEL